MERTCENCNKDVHCQYSEMPIGCMDFEPIPILNGDGIRSKNDEELAVFIEKNVKNCCDFCDCDVKGAKYHSKEDCIRGITKWLKQPRKVEE